MKMIIAIVNDEESETVTHALTNGSFRVTTIASTGGFLRKGLTTLICALEDEKLPDALGVIRGCYPPLKESAPTRCRLFVINVAEYHHF